MAIAKTTPDTTPRPVWPWPDIVTLYAHRSGQWARKYTLPDGRRVARYFGSWRPGSDPRDALAEWRARDLAIRTGTELEHHGAGSIGRRPTLRALVIAYLAHRHRQIGPSGITPSTFRTDRHALLVLLRTLDPHRPADQLGPADFTAFRHRISRYAPSTIGSVIGGVRRMYRWANEEHGLAVPVFGSSFRAPKRRVFRRHRRHTAAAIYTPAEIRTMLAASGPTLRAAIYLAINGGLGASDLAEIPLAALQRRLSDDHAAGMRARIAYPRAKTEIMRSVSVWPESLRAILSARTIAPASSRLLPSRSGGPVAHTAPGRSTRTDTIAKAFGRMLERTGLRGHYYLLRHTFATRADILGDRDTRRLIMGHAAGAMDETYVHAHGWDRVEATCESVRAWVFDVDPATVRGPWSGVLPVVPESFTPRPGRRTDRIARPSEPDRAG